jgi:MULE transposase domain/FLYWCH zinc finger domain
MNEFFWMKNQNEKDMLIVDNFIFHFNKEVHAKTYWRCSNENCRITAISEGRSLVSLSGDHCHSSNEDKIISYQLRDIMRERLIDDPSRTAQEIYDYSKLELVNIHRHARNIMHLLPSFDKIKSNIYRWRSSLVPTGSAIDEESFRYDYFLMENQRNMLLHVEFGHSPMVILGDIVFIEKFTRAIDFKITMDGTFKSSSSSFFQVYIIHGFLSGQSFPILYCFLSNKTQDTYTRMLRIIKIKLFNNNVLFYPTMIQIDFEQAAYNAIRAVFPETVVRGCYFHFGQSIWRNVQKLGLLSLYHENIQFKKFVQCTSTLPLLPLERVDWSWQYIKSLYPSENTAVLELISYVENTWLAPTGVTLFSRETWHQYGILRGRTNNAAEGFHSKLNRRINKPRVNFWEVSNIILSIQSYSEIEYQRIISGGAPKSRKKAYILQDQKIGRLWSLYQIGNIDLVTLIDQLKQSIKLDV